MNKEQLIKFVEKTPWDFDSQKDASRLAFLVENEVCLRRYLKVALDKLQVCRDEIVNADLSSEAGIRYTLRKQGVAEGLQMMVDLFLMSMGDDNE